MLKQGYYRSLACNSSKEISITFSSYSDSLLQPLKNVLGRNQCKTKVGSKTYRIENSLGKMTAQVYLAFIIPLRIL